MNSEAISTYLTKNYLTIEQVAARANVSPSRILELVANQCIFQHSHIVDIDFQFSSLIFGSTDKLKATIHHYHTSIIYWIKKAEHLTLSYSLHDTANIMKQNFMREYSQAYQQLLLPEAELQKSFAENWLYLLNGTYGVCLKEITAVNILRKNVVIAQLSQWINNQNTFDLATAHDLLNQYDAIAMPFGPHEIIKSSRERIYAKAKRLTGF